MSGEHRHSHSHGHGISEGADAKHTTLQVDHAPDRDLIQIGPTSRTPPEQ